MPTVVYFDDEDIHAEAGESVDVEVFISSDGTFAADVAEIELVAEYDGEYLNPVEVTPGEWLEQGTPTTVETETDVDEQSEQVVVHQWRDPPEGGAEGFGRFATITFAVPADTPSTETRLTFDETSVTLTDGNPMPVFANTATIHIDGDEADSDGTGTHDETDMAPQSESAAGQASDDSPSGFFDTYGVGLLVIGVILLAGVGFAGAVALLGRRGISGSE